MNFIAKRRREYNSSGKAFGYALTTHWIYLVDRVRVNCVVETSVQIVEEIDHLKGRRARGYRREADNVRKVNRDLAKLLGVDGHAELQFFGDRAESTDPSGLIFRCKNCGNIKISKRRTSQNAREFNDYSIKY